GSSLLGPEFEIFNTSTAILRINFVNDAGYGKIGTMTTDISPYVNVAGDPNVLMDKLNAIMMHGQMSPKMGTPILEAVNVIPDNKGREQAAIYLIASSSQYQVEH